MLLWFSLPSIFHAWLRLIAVFFFFIISLPLTLSYDYALMLIIFAFDYDFTIFAFSLRWWHFLCWLSSPPLFCWCDVLSLRFHIAFTPLSCYDATMPRWLRACSYLPFAFDDTVATPILMPARWSFLHCHYFADAAYFASFAMITIFIIRVDVIFSIFTLKRFISFFHAMLSLFSPDIISYYYLFYARCWFSMIMPFFIIFRYAIIKIRDISIMLLTLQDDAAALSSAALIPYTLRLICRWCHVAFYIFMPDAFAAAVYCLMLIDFPFLFFSTLCRRLILRDTLPFSLRYFIQEITPIIDDMTRRPFWYLLPFFDMIFTSCHYALLYVFISMFILLLPLPFAILIHDDADSDAAVSFYDYFLMLLFRWYHFDALRHYWCDFTRRRYFRWCYAMLPDVLRQKDAAAIFWYDAYTPWWWYITMPRRFDDWWRYFLLSRWCDARRWRYYASMPYWAPLCHWLLLADMVADDFAAFAMLFRCRYCRHDDVGVERVYYSSVDYHMMPLFRCFIHIWYAWTIFAMLTLMLIIDVYAFAILMLFILLYDPIPCFRCCFDVTLFALFFLAVIDIRHMIITAFSMTYELIFSLMMIISVAIFACRWFTPIPPYVIFFIHYFSDATPIIIFYFILMLLLMPDTMPLFISSICFACRHWCSLRAPAALSRWCLLRTFTLLMPFIALLLMMMFSDTPLPPKLMLFIDYRCHDISFFHFIIFYYRWYHYLFSYYRHFFSPYTPTLFAALFSLSLFFCHFHYLFSCRAMPAMLFDASLSAADAGFRHYLLFFMIFLPLSPDIVYLITIYAILFSWLLLMLYCYAWSDTPLFLLPLMRRRYADIILIFARRCHIDAYLICFAYYYARREVRKARRLFSCYYAPYAPYERHICYILRHYIHIRCYFICYAIIMRYFHATWLYIMLYCFLPLARDIIICCYFALHISHICFTICHKTNPS